MTRTLTRRQIAQGLTAITSSIAVRAARADTAPIRIGVTTDLTGTSAGIARAQVNAAQLLVDQVNSAGGLIGRKIELLVRDSQMKPDLVPTTRDSLPQATMWISCLAQPPARLPWRFPMLPSSIRRSS